MVQPNIVLIMTDTQGANMLGCYERPALGDCPEARPGGLDLGTPNLDRLAATGVRFRRAYTSCPLCSPARSGIFTGLTPSVNGVHTNNLAPGWNIRHMGQHLQAAGYRTAYVGKWHLDGLDYFDSGICPSGFEDAYWYDGRRYLDSLTDDEIAAWRQGVKDWPAEKTWAHRNSDRAEAFLRKAADGDNPFFLCVSHDEPHGPFVCPPKYRERFRGFRYPVGPGGRDTLDNKPLHQHEWAGDALEGEGSEFCERANYLGCNSFVDAEIGRVIDAIEQYAPENTWIVYTSDHGTPMGAHRVGTKGPAMYEETCRIPFIVRPPAATDIGTGRVVSDLVSHLDLLPTVRELAGMDVPPVYHGMSLLPVLRGTDWPDRVVPMEFTRYAINHDGWGGYQPIRAVVRESHKLVINLLHTDEFYDLETDPAELVNRIDDPACAAIRDTLHDALLTELNRLRDPFRGYCWERRPWRQDRTIDWGGVYRSRPDDGFSPPALAYATGKPSTEA